MSDDLARRLSDAMDGIVATNDSLAEGVARLLVGRHVTAARALRWLQVLDERTTATLAPAHRELLIRAESLLGETLGLDCTGVEDGWNDDGTVAFFSHDGGTCPIHEWLVEADHAAIPKGVLA